MKSILPQRIIVSIFGTTGCALVYILRSNLSVAIVAMVDKNTTLDDNDIIESREDLCYEAHNSTDYNPGYSGKYKWSESLQGIILGSYFYTYCITQITGGRLTERWGAKWVCGLGVFLPAIFNALIPIGVKIHVSSLIIIRLLMGFFHGLVFSSLFSLYAKWFPKEEMTIPITATLFGGNMGAVIVMPLTGYLCKYDFLDGWPSSFYVTSLIHVIWFALWCLFVFNTPSEDPRISQQELSYILENISSINLKAKNKITVPWKSILRSGPVWASIISKICGSFGYYVLCTKLPKYLDSVFGMAIHTNSWFNSLLYFVLCVSLMIGGPLSNYIINQKWFLKTRVRKIFQSIATVGSGLCLLLIPSMNCNKDLVIVLLLVGMFIYGFFSGGEYSVIPEFAPDLSGTIFGVANTLGSTTGFVAPLIVGLLLETGEGGRHPWNIVWYTSGSIYIFGAIIFEIYGSAEPQMWAVLAKTDNSMLKNNEYDCHKFIKLNDNNNNNNVVMISKDISIL